ncbi:MAG TPA: sensor histidine kinase [Clostridiaceae bacterium]|nr:sensor histidine kinase [Clostridiaceae bacterium]
MKKKAHSIKKVFAGSIARKLFTLIVFGVLLPFFILNGFFYRSIISNSMSNYINMSLNTMTLLSSTVKGYFDSIDDMIMDLYRDDEFFVKLRNGFQDYVDKRDFEDKIIRILRKNKEFNSIEFYVSKNHSLYKFSKNFHISSVTITNNLTYQEIEKTNRIPFIKNTMQKEYAYITPSHEMTVDEKGKKVKGFSFNRQIKNLPGGNILGIISINIKYDYLSSICNSAMINPNESIFICSVSGDITFGSKNDAKIISNLKSAIDKISYSENTEEKGIIKPDGENWIAFYNKIPFSEILLIKLIPYDSIYAEITKIAFRNIGISMILLSFVVIIVILVSLSITRPLSKLREAMNHIKSGNYNVSVRLNGADELSAAVETFNLMAEKINKLINEHFKAQLSEKTAQLEALQSKINPHFLSNTLQTIKYLAVRRNAFEVSEIVDALAPILRYSIYSFEGAVKLSDEIRNVERYLLIQKYRYLEKLNYKVYVDPEVEDFQLPRVTLQPLVENSVIHGIEEGTGKGCIEVNCLKKDGNVIISIVDDGRGFSEDKRLSILEDIKKYNMRNMEESSSIGIRNVFYRLKLFFGDKILFFIDSEPYKKTEVKLIILMDEPSAAIEMK